MKFSGSADFDLDRNIDLFDELPLWSAPFGLKLLNHIHYKPGISALDIGFGNGFPLTEIAMRLGTSSIVYGIDPWKSVIERVKRKMAFYGITNITIFEGLAESIPLPDLSIDLITSNNGINNVADIGRVFSECSRVMKPGGQFLQTMNLDKTMIEFYNIYEQVLLDHAMQNEIDMMHHHIAQKRPPLEGIVNQLGSNGFIVKQVLHDEFKYRFTNGTAMMDHYFIRLAFMDAWIKFLPSENVNLIFNEIETRLNHLAKQNDGIQLSVPFVLIESVKE